MEICRDIKGANLLVDASGVVKLADFGMAKLVSFLNFLFFGCSAICMTYESHTYNGICNLCHIHNSYFCCLFTICFVFLNITYFVHSYLCLSSSFSLN